MKKWFLLYLGIFMFNYLQASPFDLVQKLNGDKIVIDQNVNKVVLVFWASWCSDCQSKLKETLPAVHWPANVLLLPVSRNKTVNDINEFIKKHQITIPVYWDKTQSLAPQLKAFSVPHTILYEKKHDAWVQVDSQGSFDELKVKEFIK